MSLGFLETNLHLAIALITQQAKATDMARLSGQKSGSTSSQVEKNSTASTALQRTVSLGFALKADNYIFRIEKKWDWFSFYLCPSSTHYLGGNKIKCIKWKPELLYSWRNLSLRSAVNCQQWSPIFTWFVWCGNSGRPSHECYFYEMVFRIKRSFEAPSLAAEEVKVNSFPYPPPFHLRITHGVTSRETSLRLLVNPGTPVFTVLLRLCQLQFGTETSNSFIQTIRKVLKGQALSRYGSYKHYALRESQLEQKPP